MLYAILKPIAVALMRLFFRLEVVSPGLVPATGPVLLVSNHVSVLDPPFVGGAAPRPLYFMAKEELFRIPLLGRLIRALNARPVRRDGSDTRALKAALAQLEEGHALLVFPEGTRGEEGRPLREGKAGVGMLAVKRAGDDGRKEAYREAAQEMMRAIGQLREQQMQSAAKSDNRF
jgi:1-acyl-sn-glycerol-3-phosphate acyltransferase